MTIQQCKYVLEIAKTGSLSEAAKSLFVAQSSLSNCIKQLEAELSIQIFDRSNRGMVLTADGAEFIRYVGQIAKQSDFIAERYSRSENKQKLHIATQHYDFISDIFCSILNENNFLKYHFSLKEIKTYDMIHEVETARSDIGIIAIRDADLELMERFLNKKGIAFVPFLSTVPYVYVSCEHPLSKKQKIDVNDLREFPYVFYDQGEHNTSFFTEELTETVVSDRCVEISDRATLMAVLLNTDCYTIGTGIMPSKLNDGRIASVRLLSDESYSVGYITAMSRKPSALAEEFIDLLIKFAKNKIM